MFFASDLHGSNVCFKKFVNSAKFYGVDVLVLGGDLTGKAVIPIAEQEDGTFRRVPAWRVGANRRQGRARRVRQAAGQYRFLSCGHAGVRVPAPEGGPEAAQPALFKKLVLERVREWASLPPSKSCKEPTIPLVTVPGNDDFVEIDEILTQAPHFDFHEMQVCEFKGGYQMLYCGGSTPTPWDTEREYTEEQYVTRFAELLPQVTDMSRCIFNVHVPPFGTALDACPKLDKNLQVVYEMGLAGAGSCRLPDADRHHQGASAAARPARAHPRRTRQDQYRQDDLHQSGERLPRRNSARRPDHAAGRPGHAGKSHARVTEREFW